MKQKAIVLFSGGLDSSTALYCAVRDGYEPAALTIHYGQIHNREIESARKLAAKLSIAHHVINISLPWKGSALLDRAIPIPHGRDESKMQESIPDTYVPARNSIFLSLAASYSEAIGAPVIYFGANIQDYSGYPDCRPEFLQAYEKMIAAGTKAGAEGRSISVNAPLLKLSKKEIIQLGQELGVPYELTWSCYQGGKFPCGECDSCRLRAKGFREAGLEDPSNPPVERET